MGSFGSVCILLMRRTTLQSNEIPAMCYCQGFEKHCQVYLFFILNNLCDLAMAKLNLTLTLLQRMTLSPGKKPNKHRGQEYLSHS